MARSKPSAHHLLPVLTALFRFLINDSLGKILQMHDVASRCLRSSPCGPARLGVPRCRARDRSLNGPQITLPP